MMLGGGSGTTEACAYLRTRMGNMSIIKRWRIRMRNYWSVFFFFFKKTRMGKRDGKLLELLKWWMWVASLVIYYITSNFCYFSIITKVPKCVCLN